MHANRRTHAKRRGQRNGLTALVLTLALLAGPGCDNFLGLQDWQRDLLGLGIGGLGDAGALAVALLTGGGPAPAPAPDPIPGIDGPQGPAGADGPPGPAGADGADGADGNSLFHVFIDDYFTQTDRINGWFGDTGDFIPDIIAITEPVLGEDDGGTPAAPGPDANRIAFRVLIPPSYAGANPVTMRLALRRLGGPIGAEAFAFNVYVRRLVDGSNGVDNYVPVQTFTATPPAAGNTFEFQVYDLPLNVAVPNGLGGGPLSAGDLIAVELTTVGNDGGEYLLLGVEFYETTAAPAVAGGTIS